MPKWWRQTRACGMTHNAEDGSDVQIGDGPFRDLATIVLGLLDHIPDARGSRFEARQAEIEAAAERLREVMRRGE